MTIVVYSAPAVEPLTVAEVMHHCRIDASNTEPAPGVITAALPGTPVAGNVDNGAHRYRATFVTADGETDGGTISAAVTVADKTVNGKVSLTAIPLGGSLVTSRKLYRTAAGGSTYLLLATLADNTTVTYVDNIADSALGAEAPSTNSTGDPEINRLIKVARQEAEQELHRYLITQTLDAYFDEFPRYANPRFPDRDIRLPPLQSVTAITYTDTDGVTQTLAADQYVVDANTQPVRIESAYGVSWPSTRDQHNAVKVRFVAGYGAAASAVPDCIKQWMLLRIADLHPIVQQPMPGYAHSLLDPERVTGRI